MKNILSGMAIVFMVGCGAHADTVKNDNKLFYEARVLLDSDSSDDRNKGQASLQEMTGRSIQARYSLGWWLLMVKGDEKKGISLISSAQFEDNSSAGYFIADIYKNGRGLEYLKNEGRAVRVLRNALQKAKDPSANEEQILGKWLIEQDRVKNKKEAIYWLERSLNHDNLFAISILVPLLVEGEERDLVKAWFYSDLRGTGMASEKHAIEKQMTPEQREQAQEMSWQWQDEHHIHVPGYRGQGSPLRWQVESH